MVLKHHTLNPFDRKPQGAVATGGQVRLRLTVEDEQAPVELFLRVWNGDERRYPMRPLGLKDGRMIYEAQIGVGDKPRLLWYRFECEYKGEHVVLGAPGDHTGCGEGVMGSEESFQLTVYDAAYDTPAWMRDGVMYQIMVDRFCHGEGTDALMHAKDGQNIILHEDWNEMPFLNIAENGDNFANDFFGGNLEGVRQKLPYLKQLGVSVLYFNPIFCARTNHKYDTSDYRRVDPMFGDEQALARLCKEAETLGMRVMLDGVFSHVGDDSLYFNRRGTYGEHVGAYRDPDSPYYKWFTFRHWPDDYECWWGFKTLPNVNEMDEDYRRFILKDDDSVVRHWVRKGTSGWRLDVADELPMPFLRELRRQVKDVSGDAAVLGEVWEDASHKVAYGQMRSYVLGDTLDSVMNYPLRDALIAFLMAQKDAAAVAKELSSLAQNYPKPFLYALMNLMGSHDRPRILNVLAGNDGSDIPRSQRADHRLSQEERMIGALREIAEAHPNGTAAVFSHGMAIRLTVGTLQGLSLHEIDGTGHAENTAVSRLEYENGAFRVAYRDDASHLENGLQTLKRQAWLKNARGFEGGIYYVPSGAEGHFDVCRAGETVGAVSVDKCENGLAVIGEFWLENDVQGLGFGQQLVGQALSYARAHGCERLSTGHIAKGNALGLRRAREWGFTQTGEGADWLEFQKNFEYDEESCWKKLQEVIEKEK